MNLATAVELQSGGPGSGRHKGNMTEEDKTFNPKKTLDELHKVFVEASGKKQMVMLSYHKEGETKPKNYLVEPYSYRGDKLFAYDSDNKSIKAFNLLRIADAKVHSNTYEPRWPVEFKARK